MEIYSHRLETWTNQHSVQFPYTLAPIPTRISQAPFPTNLCRSCAHLSVCHWPYLAPLITAEKPQKWHSTCRSLWREQLQCGDAHCLLVLLSRACKAHSLFFISPQPLIKGTSHPIPHLQQSPVFLCFGSCFSFSSRPICLLLSG